MFRRSRFSIRPNVGTGGRTAAIPQESPSANQEASETPRDISESIGGTAVTDNTTVLTPVEQTTNPGDGGDQNGEGNGSSAAVQRRKRFSVKPKVAPGRPTTLARTAKTPIKAVYETPGDVSGSDKPATSSQTGPTAAPRGFQSPKRRRSSEDIKQSKVQPKPTAISSDTSAGSTVPPSEDSLVQTHLPADSCKHLESVPGSQVKEVPPRPPDRIPPFIPDKEAIELSEKAKTLVSSKSGLSLSPSALSLSRLLNDPSDLQRLAKAQKLRQLLKEEKHKEQKLKKAKARLKEYTVDPAKMTMRDLIRYLPMSNPMMSSLEHSNQESETVVPTSPGTENRSADKAEEPEVLSKTGSPRKGENEEAEEEQEEALMVPQVKVAEDGSLIIDEESLTVEVQRAKGPNPAQDRDPIFERGSTTTYSSFRTSTCPKPWSSEETDMFFLAVSMVGTDFSMICQLFPHRARAEIKNKFKREERDNSWRIDKAFRERRRLDIEYFSKLLEKIMEFQKNRKKLKSLAEKNSSKKWKKKKATGKKATRKLSDVEEEDEEDDDEIPDLDEEEGEKENELLCNEAGASASKPKRQRKRKTRQDASNEEPNDKKNKMDEDSIPENTEAALPEEPPNSDMSKNTENVTAVKDSAVKPVKPLRGGAPKPLLPLGHKWGKKVPPPTTTAKDTGAENVSDGAPKEQENKDGSPSRGASKQISANDEISSEEEEAALQPPRRTRYGRVPKPTKLLTYHCKEDTDSSASETTSATPEGNSVSAAKPKPKCKAKRGRASKPQSDQESKKPKLVTLRASQSDYSDEENEEQWEQDEVEEEQHPPCSPSKDSTAPAFVPASLRSPHLVIPVVEETMEELDILANMPDVLGISQDAMCPEASCEQAQNEIGTAEPSEHQLDLLVDVIHFLSSEQPEVSEDESYNEAAQTLLTISNLTHLCQPTQNQMATQYLTKGTISNIETSQNLEGEIPSNPAADEQSATTCTPAVFDNGVKETSEVVATVDLQNSTVDRDVVKTNDHIFNEKRTGFAMSHTSQLQSSPESSKKTSLCLQSEASTVTKLVPKEATPKIPECTLASLKDDNSCAEVRLTEEPSGSQERSVESGPTTSYQNVSERQSSCFSGAQSVSSLQQATQQMGSSSESNDRKWMSHTESGSNIQATSDISVAEPQVELGLNEDSVFAQEGSHNSAAVEDLPVGQEPHTDLASTCVSRRSRLQKVKPKPNLVQTSRTPRPKPQITKNATEKDSSLTEIPKFHEKTIAVADLGQTCATSRIKASQNASPPPDLMSSLDLGSTVTPTEELSTAVEKNTDDGPIGEADSGIVTSGQSVSENQNFSEDQFIPNTQARTLPGSISESTDESLGLPVGQEPHTDLASTCLSRRSRLQKVKPKPNLAQTSRTARPKPQITKNATEKDSSLTQIPEFHVEHGSNTDSVPVEDGSSHSDGFVTPVKHLPVSQEAESEVTSACQSRRSHLPKVKPKPNLPQTSRTAQSKPKIIEDSIEKDCSPATISKFQEESVAEKEPEQTCVTPAENPTQTTDVGLFGQEDLGATSSGESASENQKFTEIHFQPSQEEASRVPTLESIECNYNNGVSSDSAVTESKAGQGPNKDSVPVTEGSDQSAAFVIPVDKLPVSQKVEDEIASTWQSRRRRLQKVKPKLPQMARSTSSEPQPTKDPVTQKPSNSGSRPEFIDNPIAQPTCTTIFPETASVSVLSLEKCTNDQKLSSTEDQKTDVVLDSSSEGSEPSVPQRRQRFPKVKPKLSITSSIRTRSKLQAKDNKPEKHHLDMDKNNAHQELEPMEHDSKHTTSIHSSINTELLSLTKSAPAESEMSLDSTKDMDTSSDGMITATSMLADLVPENIDGENSTGDKMSSNSKVEVGPDSQGDCKMDMSTGVTELNTQPVDDPTSISYVNSAQQSCEILENNQTSNNKSQSAYSTDQSKSESAESVLTLRKAPSTRRGRLKPRPNLERSTQPPQPQEVQNTTQTEIESGSWLQVVDTSISHILVSEPVEGAVEQHSRQDSPPNDAGSSLGCSTHIIEQLSQHAGSSHDCLTQVACIQNTSTSSQEGAQSHPCLAIFADMLSEQVPSDPEEPFFILSLTEIPVCPSGEVVDSADEPLSYLPLTDASIQQQSVPGESLAAAAGDGSLSDIPVPMSTEDSGERSVINVKDAELDPTECGGLIVKNPVDAHESTTVQSPMFSETVENIDDIESLTTKQKLTVTGGRAKLQVKPSSTRGFKTPTENTTQDLQHHGPSVQPETFDVTVKAEDEVVTEPHNRSVDQAETETETLCTKDSSLGASSQSTKTRVTRSQTRNCPLGKAVSKSSKVKTPRAAGKRSSIQDVTPTLSPPGAQSTLSTASPTQTEADVEHSRQCTDPTPSTCQGTAEGTAEIRSASQVSAFQQSDYLEEEPTSVSQYFLSDIFIEVEEE